jgi:hypothetical protein
VFGSYFVRCCYWCCCCCWWWWWCCRCVSLIHSLKRILYLSIGRVWPKSNPNPTPDIHTQTQTHSHSNTSNPRVSQDVGLFDHESTLPMSNAPLHSW